MKPSRFNAIWAILISTAAVTIGRAFLEFFSNPEVGGIISPWYVTLGYFLFFLSTTIGLGIIIGIIVRESYLKWTLKMAKMLPIVFLAPILDLIFSHGQGICMAYLGSSQGKLLADLLTYFGTLGTCGITPGIRIELLFVIGGIGWIIWKKTHSQVRMILGIVISYLFIFLQLAIPGLLGTFALIGNYSGPWIFDAINHSVLALNENTLSYSQFGIAVLMSQVHLITTVILACIVWLKEESISFYAWFKNSRFERLGYYGLYLVLGIVTASSFGFFKSWVNDISFIIAIISLVTNFWLAVIVNDLADVSIDEISNPSRPLESKTFDESTYKKFGVVLFLVMIVSALLVNYAFFLFMIAFQLMYAAYSLREIRWKKHFIPASVAVGACGIATILAGYFIAMPSYPISHLPLTIIIWTWIIIAVISNFKDFKDRKGDKADNIKTLPVLIGSRKTSYVITLSLIAWCIVTGFIFHQGYFYICAIVFALFAFLATKIKFPEFVGFGVISILIIGIMIFVR